MSSIFRRVPVIAEVALESLRVHIVRLRATPGAFADAEAAYNFSDILARLAAQPKSPEPPSDGPPPRFSLNNLHLDDGAVIFDDVPTGDHHEITNLSVGIPFASTLPVYVDSFVEPGLSVKIDGTTFAAQARSKPFRESRDTVLALRLQGLDLTRYLPFVPLRLPVALRSARLSLALDVGFSRAADDAPRLTLRGDLSLEALDVEQKERAGLRPLLAVKRVDITIADSDLTSPQVHLQNIVITDLHAHLRRERDGTLALQHLFPAAPPPEPEHAKHPKREEQPGVRFTHRRLRARERRHRLSGRGRRARAGDDGARAVGHGPRSVESPRIDSAGIGAAARGPRPDNQAGGDAPPGAPRGQGHARRRGDRTGTLCTVLPGPGGI